MEIYNKKASEDTPKVILDADNGIFELSGVSVMNDATGFYKPILEWLRRYAKSPGMETVFIFKMEWFNTPSSKMILDVMMELKKIQNIKVVWYYHEELDEDEEIGVEFSEITEIPFDFRTL